MARAATAPPSSSFSSLERTLDRTIECLVGGPQTREARALLIEARRLRSVVGNWRSIPPPDDVRDEMLERVLKLSTSVGAAFPESIDEIAGRDGEPSRGSPNPSGSDSGAPAPFADEETEGYALDFEPQLYSLEGATNPKVAAVPVPAPPPPAPVVEAHPIPDEAPVNSEDEPTQAWSNAGLQAPPDFEPEPSAPAPWPVDEPPDRISAIVPAPRPKSVAPPPMPPPARPPMASSPDLRGPEATFAPRVTTYEFDGEGDDLSVPRTRITAHAVKVSDPVDPLLVVLAEPYSPRADAYRTMRRKLAGSPARVLGVTSAGAGEGKTVFAVNLALTLRESAKSRVLVIYANLRTPSMGKLLGFETPDCFLEQLKRHAEDPRAPWVVAEPLPKLHVMAIDPKTPHEPLLDPVQFSAGMERIKQAGYEYVVVDSPPVLGSLDCNVIADSVDGMILVALQMKSLRRPMRKAVEQLDPAPILGVVVLEA